MQHLVNFNFEKYRRIHNYQDDSRDVESIDHVPLESKNFQQTFINKFDLGADYWGKRIARSNEAFNFKYYRLKYDK